jgi:hypothetical protein
MEKWRCIRVNKQAYSSVRFSGDGRFALIVLHMSSLLPQARSLSFTFPQMEVTGRQPQLNHTELVCRTAIDAHCLYHRAMLRIVSAGTH